MADKVKEALRYLGYGNRAPDDRVAELVDFCFNELERACEPKLVSQVFELNVPENGGDSVVYINGLKFESKNLRANLRDCVKVAAIGATLGVQADLLLNRYSRTEIAKAAALQACAAAALEDFLDARQLEFSNKVAAGGFCLRPRFSPGYGDFDVRYQETILRMIDAPKKIGLTTTSAHMLAPTKSVTALAGLCRSKPASAERSCDSCVKADCQYRKTIYAK